VKTLFVGSFEVCDEKEIELLNIQVFIFWGLAAIGNSHQP
jgi:hypothetical protein